jgi:class 3 adenylate cyclase/tetratricopeptide (TPR) repeat protein
MTSLSEFLPTLVASRRAPLPWSDRLPGAPLFADVSGFTPMSEALARLGPEGAEILTDILNRYFAEMIGAARERGGEVMKFGGDAILCLFPGEEGLARALAAAIEMQRRGAAYQRVRTPVRRFALRMKIGVAEGEVLLGAVGDPRSRCEHFVAGGPIDDAADAEHRAKEGETILRVDTLPTGIEGEGIGEGFWRIRSAPEAGGAQGLSPGDPGIDPTPFLVPEVATAVSAGLASEVGALQEAVSVFLRFSGISYDRERFDLHRLDRFFRAVDDGATAHGGRLNRLSMGDKGSTILLFFGAPNPLERKEERASQWALELFERIGDEFPGISARVGMTSGRLFSGIVGGNGRSDYTAMGDVVNLAARLMQGAEEGQILTDEPFAQRAEKSFELQTLGRRRFKGKAEPLPVHALRGRRDRVRLSAAARFLVGRERLLAELEGRIEEAAKGAPVAQLLVGKAGSGKSALAEEVAARGGARGFGIGRGEGDLVLRHEPHRPWRELLEGLFFGGSAPTLELLGALLAGRGLEGEGNLALHADFWGLARGGSRPTTDEYSRQRLLHRQIAKLLLDGGTDPPRLLLLENLQWWDSLSIELLRTILDHLEGHGVLLLATARPEWDRKVLGERPFLHVAEIANLDREGTALLAQHLFGGEASRSLIDLLFDRTGGSPLLTQELVRHLLRRKLVFERFGEWSATREAAADSSGAGEEILLAEIERLGLREKALLRLAACLGRSFPEGLLLRVSGRGGRSASLSGIEQAGLLRRSAGGRLEFTGALSQEVLHASLPGRLRRRLHGRIARVLETAPSPEVSTAEIAAHLLQSGRARPAADAAIRAGRELAARLAFPEAATFLGAAFELLRRRRDDRKGAVGLELADCLLRGGKLLESRKAAADVRAIARRGGDRKTMRAADAAVMDARARLGDFDYLASARRLLQEERASGETDPKLSCLAGVALARRGFRDAAMGELASVATEGGVEPELVVRAALWLSNIERYRGDFEAAIRHLENARGVTIGAGAAYQELLLLAEEAGVLTDGGRQEEARRRCEEGVRRAEELGDRYLVGTILVNLGICFGRLGRPEAAEKTLREATEIAQTLGSTALRAKSTMALGTTLFESGRSEEAYDAYQAAVRTCEETGERADLGDGYFNLAEAAIALGRTEVARSWLDRAKRESAGDPSLLEDLRSLEAKLPNR